eukprot:TRINITY_DN6560_c0_g1_i1.p1 TRINITY_DN6560_c0_g1~~TRINITY_DN6560_c0_g1_i1.p1  ORF type:complete len:172 (-),score=15.09 TRINITY_DN6560_c0_g1_i1:204-719(-)
MYRLWLLGLGLGSWVLCFIFFTVAGISVYGDPESPDRRTNIYIFMALFIFFGIAGLVLCITWGCQRHRHNRKKKRTLSDPPPASTDVTQSTGTNPSVYRGPIPLPPDLEMSDAEMQEMSKYCKLCFEKLPDAVFHPCGHEGCCLECAEKQKESHSGCPFCREAVYSVEQKT